ncbi:UspA domain-containing protein [Metallosphaera cuprina Ar-4]|uniref:UspA domain-containing protein n=1 Tax=Metallosphaera cuprina (strain Ar-4) TaxID=1006006 RepID=F4G371_METCR|nr:UspA domain-containing protein [Metallosphaera cuprina Ar-4]
MAKHHSSKVVVVEALDPGEYVIEAYYKEDLRKKREVISLHTEEIKRMAIESGISIEYKVATGPPEEVITKFAEEEDVDLIVLGTRGHKGFKKLILGSVSSAVAERTKKPVLVVK